MDNFTIDDIKLAYRKLKSSVYYDNFSLILRQGIAKFESAEDFKDKLERLTEYLNNTDKDEEYFRKLLGDVDYYTAPKSWKREESKYRENIIRNNFSQESYELKKINYFFDGPIELHIITVLWILHEGYVLHGDYDTDNYAYFLELNPDDNKVVNGLRLFKPYFSQYQRWRDKGLDIAKKIAEEDTDVVILSLDIKGYYYNINYDKSKQDELRSIISERLGKDCEELPFTKMVFEIHDKYQKKCPHNNGTSILPIGLLSSGILANWFLYKFDKHLKEELSATYYGRYVDDLLIVLSGTKITKKECPKSESPLTHFLDKILVKRKIFYDKPPEENEETDSTSEKKETDSTRTYYYANDKDIIIQKEKIRVFSFESKDSLAMLDMFKKNIEHNSSAFWFLPTESDISKEFDESAYELTYSDTINKLRSVSEIKPSKYNASVFLAKRIKVNLLSDKRKDDKTTKQILAFFKGTINLDFYHLWEKVLTYFVIANDKDSFWIFFKETVNSIEKIQFSKELRDDMEIVDVKIVDVKKHLFNYLKNCCAIATSLNPNFVENWWEKKCSNFKYKWLSKNFHKEIHKTKKNYISSNLLRHNYVVVPLLNYLKTSDKINFVKYEDLEEIVDKSILESMEFDENKLKYAPRFVYLHEFNLFYYQKYLLHKKENDFVNFSQIHEDSFTTFFNVNYKFRNNYDEQNNTDSISDFKKILKDYFHHDKEYRSENGKVGYDLLAIPNSKKIHNQLRIGVVNTRVLLDNIEKSLFERPNTNKKRRKELIDILNDSEKVKADILIFPEISTPYKWLHLIADEARRKQRVIIVGLEHIRIHNTCYNLLATCLPLKRNGIRDVVVSLRLKNHYSPKETETIENRRKKIPIALSAIYNRFFWGGISFSNYNCYELADIEHRALFRSKVDILFATEYNQDTEYFSSIAESIIRDVHCYFVQVNSADFGDSRIIAPTRAFSKDILRFKGGENNLVVLGKIDINKLRNFQRTIVRGQDTNIFKNTPPNFDHSEVDKRNDIELP